MYAFNIRTVYILILVAFQLFSAEINANPERADYYDAYSSAEHTFTDVGELPIKNTPWFGPIQVHNNGDQPLNISGHHSLSLDFEVVSIPEPIPPGQAGTVEVIFQPRSVGLLMPRLELTTSAGRIELMLRAQVTSENAWQVLGYAWPQNHYPLSEVKSVVKSADVVMEDLKDPENANTYFLIDPRPAPRFSAAHISDAINLPIHAILQREDWKDKTLVFVDEGSLQNSVYAGILRLRAAGFTESYWLDGGMRGWLAAGGEVEGPVAASGQWAGLYPREIGNSLLREQFVILNAAGESKAEAIRSVFPGQKYLQWRGDYEAVSKDAPILVIATSDNACLNIEPILQDEGFQRVYYLHEGFQNLLKNLNTWNTNPNTRLKLVRAGARNPLGKDLPQAIVDRDCIDCLKRSRR